MSSISILYLKWIIDIYAIRPANMNLDKKTIHWYAISFSIYWN